VRVTRDKTNRHRFAISLGYDLLISSLENVHRTATRAARSRAHVRSIIPIDRIACAAKYRGYHTHARPRFHVHPHDAPAPEPRAAVLVVVVVFLPRGEDVALISHLSPRRAGFFLPVCPLLPRLEPPCLRGAARAVKSSRLMRALSDLTSDLLARRRRRRTRGSFYRALVNPGA